MCFDFVKPFCTHDSYVISSGEEIFPASFPLVSNKTVLDDLASTNCSDAEFEAEGEEMRQGGEITWADGETTVCVHGLLI